VHVDPDPIGAGRDPEFLERVTPLLDVYTKWYRPDVRGFESLPAVGEPFLLAGNHNGGATPPDLPILLTAWWRERGYEEPVYGLFHSFFLSLPGVGTVMSKTGALDANPVDAERALRAGAPVVVYPGGDHEAFRPWSARDTVDFAGRKGFVRLALRTGVPIVPVTIRGTFAMLPRTSLAPRPGRVDVIIAEPIETSGYDEKTLPALIERTRAAIAANL